jgi:hypothetical protein
MNGRIVLRVNQCREVAGKKILQSGVIVSGDAGESTDAARI